MSTSELQPTLRFDRWAVASMFLVNGFVVGSWVPHIPGFVDRLGIGEFGLGLLILGYGLSATLVMTLAGQMIARRGSGGTLRLFALPLVAMLPLAMLVSEIWMAVCFLLLFGGIIGGMDVAMNANVVAVEKSHGRAMMSTSHGCWSLGGFAGGSLGGLGSRPSAQCNMPWSWRSSLRS
jgi:predicted MFS family arabinose efflux permease